VYRWVMWYSETGYLAGAWWSRGVIERNICHLFEPTRYLSRTPRTTQWPT
jgi:hypothetical protein